MVIKISGLDKIQKELADVTKALDSIDGKITNLQFDPDDPKSIQAAINKMNKAIDDKVGYYKNNSIATQMIEKVKAGMREKLLQRVKELQSKNKK